MIGTAVVITGLVLEDRGLEGTKMDGRVFNRQLFEVTGIEGTIFEGEWFEGFVCEGISLEVTWMDGMKLKGTLLESIVGIDGDCGITNLLNYITFYYNDKEGYLILSFAQLPLPLRG